MYRLTKLIFIDSYSPGRRASINLIGNTNLNGDNGRGKTTMLRVLPLFFGASPGQLVRRSGTNKSFVDYYLPNSTSYIIFEYERDLEKNLVVIFRSDNSLRFRFMKSAYDDGLFFDDTNEQSNVIAASNWAKTMKLKGHDPSQMLGVEDYKSVIQSGLNFTDTSDRKRKSLINDYRRLYSFCQHGSSIQNIDLITTAILEREPSIEAIKEILTSILIHNNITHSEEIPTLTVKSTKLTEWMNDRDAYQAMSGCESDIRHLNQLKIQYDDCITGQKTLRSQAEFLLEQRKEALEFADQQRDKDKNTLDTHREQQSKQYRVYLDTKNALESKIKLAKQSISRLQCERDSFSEMSIEEKRSMVVQLPQMQQDKVQLEKHYETLINDQQNIEDKFEKLKSQLKESHQSKLLSFSEQEKVLLEEHHNKLLLINSEQHKKLDAEGKRYFDVLEQLQNRLSITNEEKVELKSGLTHILPPPELKHLYQLAEKKLQALHLKTPELDKAINQAVFAQEAHEGNIKANSQTADIYIKEKDQIEQQLDRLKHLKSPDKNNLLTFLRENHDSWAENIAKVIPEELLLRTDLSPEMTNSEFTLYGVKLDLSAIETSRAADESFLQQQILQLTGDLVEKEIEIKGLSDSNKQLVNESKSFETAVFKARNCRHQHDGVIQETAEQLDFHQSEIDAALSTLKVDIEKKMQDCDIRVQSEKSNIEVHKKNYEAEKRAIQKKFKIEHDALDKALQDSQDLIHQEKDALKARHEYQLGQFDEKKATELVEHGVNPKLLASFTSALKAAKDKLALAVKNKPVVDKYQQWLKNDWSQFDTFEEDYYLNDKKLIQCRKEWNLRKEDFTRGEKKLEIIFKSTEDRCQKLSNDMKVLQRMLKDFPDRGELAEKNTPLTEALENIPLLESRWEKLLKRDQELSKEGIATYNQVRKNINVFRDSSPQKFLERLSVDISHKTDNLRNEWRFAAVSLADYMRKDHLEYLSILQSTARLLGQQISDYYGDLSRTHRAINQLGKRVSKHSQVVIESFPSINNLTVTVASNLDKLEFWTALEKFSQSHQSWVARPLHDLPDADYIEKLKLVSQLFEKSGMDIKLSKSFDTSFRISDQGITKTARTTKELEGISSNGLSYLIIISIYTALVNMLRGNSGAVMIWPVDELGNFSANNTVKLMRSLEAQQVYLFSAFPDPDPNLLQHYTNRYLIEAGRNLVEYPDDLTSNTDYVDRLLADMEL